MNSNSCLRRARGLIVMASTDPAVEVMTIPIPKVTGIAAFARDLARVRADMKARGLATPAQRLNALASIFVEVWEQRSGARVPADQETRDNILLWGSLLLDEVPLGHFLIVQHALGYAPYEIGIATRRVFLKWTATKLPALIDVMRHESASGAAAATHVPVAPTPRPPALE